MGAGAGRGDLPFFDGDVHRASKNDGIGNGLGGKILGQVVGDGGKLVLRNRCAHIGHHVEHRGPFFASVAGVSHGGERVTSRASVLDGLLGVAVG